MKKRIGGAAIFTVATVLAFYPFPTQKEESVEEVRPQAMENQVGEAISLAASGVLP